MLKVQRVNKLVKKFLNKALSVTLFFCGTALSVFAQEQVNEQKTKTPHHTTEQTNKKNDQMDHLPEGVNLTQDLKNAEFDYNEKLFGQALQNFAAILKQHETQLEEIKITEIKVKMAHCYFELGDLLRAIRLLDPILQYNKLPLTFSNNSLLPLNLSEDKLLPYLKAHIVNGKKSLVELFPEIEEGENTSTNHLVKTLNAILVDPQKSNLLIQQYLTRYHWKNKLILQLAANTEKQEQTLLVRLMLEELYPVNTYFNAQIPTSTAKNKTDKESNKVDPLKNTNYYEALYWRSRIHLETLYYANARKGFEEVEVSLNYKETNRIIETLFYKAKATALLGYHKLAIQESENLHSLYSLNDFYKDHFFEENYYLLGRNLFELSKFDKAIIKFSTITAGYDNREPHHKLIREAYYWLGEAYYCKGELNNAIKSYNVILKYGTFDEKEKALYSLGWTLFDKNDEASKNQAKEKFEMLLKEYPNTKYRTKAEMKLAEIAIEENDLDQAEAMIRSLTQNLTQTSENNNPSIRDNSLFAQIDFLTGLLHIQKKDINTAILYFKRSENTSDLKLKQNILLHLGICYKEFRDYQKATTYFSAASKVNSDEHQLIRAKTLLGETMILQEKDPTKLEAALKIFEELINLNPNHPSYIEWYKKKAYIFRLQNKDEEAIRTLQKIPEDDSKNWESAQTEIGNILMNATPPEYNAAVNHYRKIRNKIKTTALKNATELNFGIALLNSNQQLEAIEIFLNLTKTTDENIATDAYQYLAKCYEKENNPERAVKILEESLKQYPQQKNTITIFKECVRLYQILEQYDQVIQYLEALANKTQEPATQAEILFQLAEFDLKAKHEDSIPKAVQKLKSILGKYATSAYAPQAAFRLIQLYVQEKINNDEINQNLDLLEKQFKQPALYQAGLIIWANDFYKNENFQKALELYQKINLATYKEDIKEITDTHETILEKRANCLLQTKNFEAAQNDYMALIRMSQKNITYKIRYAESSLQANTHLEDALSILQRIPNQDQNADIEKITELLRKKTTKSP